MQFGDEGKGTFIDWLTHIFKADWIVRYNSGSQAGHTVVAPDGTTHQFSQLGSGFLNGKVKEYISENMVINMDNLFTEISCLTKETGMTQEEIFDRVCLSLDCLVVTPYHKLLNRLRELSLGDKSRGSVGTGVSEVPYLYYISQPKYKHGKIYNKYGQLYVHLRDLFGLYNPKSRERLVSVFMSLRNYVYDFYLSHEKEINANMPAEMKEDLEKEIQFLLFDSCRYEYIAMAFMQKSYNLLSDYPNFMSRVSSPTPWVDELNNHGDTNSAEEKSKYTIIFEGGQGLLLDGRYGTRPNTTLLDTTNHYAMKLAKKVDAIAHGRKVHTRKIGIAKAFYSRHGKGVFPTESEDLQKYISDEHQVTSFWNGKIRFGWFDAVLFRYAQRINKVNEVFLSSLDKFNGLPKLKVCNSYRYKGTVDDKFKKLFSYYIDEHGDVIIVDILRSYKNISRYLCECEPIYITVNGWDRAVFESINGYNPTLSKECKEYIRLISTLTKVPVTCISYGPTREQKLQLGGKNA